MVVWLAALVDRVSTSATAKYKLPEEREKPKRDTSFKHTGISEGNNPSSFVEGQNVGAGAMSYSLLPPLGSMADAKVVIQAGENKQGDDLAIWCNKEYFCRNRQRAQGCSSQHFESREECHRMRFTDPRKPLEAESPIRHKQRVVCQKS